MTGGFPRLTQLEEKGPFPSRNGQGLDFALDREPQARHREFGEEGQEDGRRS